MRVNAIQAAGVLLAVSAWAVCAQSPEAEFLEKKIRPVLATNCYGCHSSQLKTPMGKWYRI